MDLHDHVLKMIEENCKNVSFSFDPYPVRGEVEAEVWGDPVNKAYIWGYNPEGSLFSYFAALHEIGHIAKGHIGPKADAHKDYYPRIVDAEAEAWEWAFENAIVKPSEEIIRKVFLTKGHYFDSYLDSHPLQVGATAITFTRKYAPRNYRPYLRP